MKHLISYLLLCTLAVANEVSVFGAGNLDSSKPYGLTSAEKHILKNKNELSTIDTKVKTVKTTLETLSQRIDGLESIYEGDSKKLNEAVLELNTLVKNDELKATEIENIKKVSSQLLTIQEENRKNNEKNLETLKEAMEKLTKLVNSINESYVSEKELKNNMSQFVTVKEFEALKKLLIKEEPKIAQKTVTKSDINEKYQDLTKAQMLDKAKELFKIDYFTDAIPLFEFLITNHYKPAESNFYLGEIWYYRKKYSEAITYFKESAMLYDKASYMPKLLLHSAISFEKVNDLENAASFYTTLINVYPNSSEAQTANKNLINLN